MARLFGTDGIRGEAGRFPLDATTVQTVGASLALHLKERSAGRAPLIITGRDTRESGAWIEHALITGAKEVGAQCKSAGVITTPGVAFLTRDLGADAGVVISASHNSYQDNGIKIFSPSGKKLEDAIERQIETDIFASRAAGSSAVEVTMQASHKESEAEELRKRYLDFLAVEIGRGLSFEGLKIVIDCANGAASHLAPELFARLRAQVVAINNQPDGRNINRDCGSLHIEGLQRRVREEHADLGVAFDGDADRSLFIDAFGNLVDGDATLWVLAKYLDARGDLNDGLVVATVMSNVGLEIALRKRGLRLVRTDVGDKHVLDELLRTGASLGGEQSGHLIFPRLSLAGDGMISTLCLLRAMFDKRELSNGGLTQKERSRSRKPIPLHQLTTGFERYPQILVNVPVREKKPLGEIEPVQSLAREIEARHAGRGRLLLRYSGTEPLARVMIEGESQAEIEADANKLATVIKETIGAE
jgi:phosphoglucosamine mutase